MKKDSKSPKTREMWTVEETDAVVDGYAMFKDSTCKWSMICEHYRDVLYNRTSVQVKDRHRTLVKNNALLLAVVKGQN